MELQAELRYIRLGGGGAPLQSHVSFVFYDLVYIDSLTPPSGCSGEVQGLIFSWDAFDHFLLCSKDKLPLPPHGIFINR